MSTLFNIMPSRSELSNQLRRARLRGFLDRESPEGGWWAVIMDEDMKPHEFWSEELGFVPPELHKQFALRVNEVANRAAHYHGVWCVAWFRHLRRWAIVWKDWDGDIQVFGDDSTDIFKLLALSPEHWAEHCTTMIETWLDKMRFDIAAKPEQQVHLAAGEKPSVPVSFEDEFMHKRAAAAEETGAHHHRGDVSRGPRRRGASGATAATR